MDDREHAHQASPHFWARPFDQSLLRELMVRTRDAAIAYNRSNYTDAVHMFSEVITVQNLLFGESFSANAEAWFLYAISIWTSLCQSGPGFRSNTGRYSAGSVPVNLEFWLRMLPPIPGEAIPGRRRRRREPTKAKIDQIKAVINKDYSTLTKIGNERPDDFHYVFKPWKNNNMENPFVAADNDDDDDDGEDDDGDDDDDNHHNADDPMGEPSSKRPKSVIPSMIATIEHAIGLYTKMELAPEGSAAVLFQHPTFYLNYSAYLMSNKDGKVSVPFPMPALLRFIRTRIAILHEMLSEVQFAANQIVAAAATLEVAISIHVRLEIAGSLTLAEIYTKMARLLEYSLFEHMKQTVYRFKTDSLYTRRRWLSTYPALPIEYMKRVCTLAALARDGWKTVLMRGRAPDVLFAKARVIEMHQMIKKISARPRWYDNSSMTIGPVCAIWHGGQSYLYDLPSEYRFLSETVVPAQVPVPLECFLPHRPIQKVDCDFAAEFPLDVKSQFWTGIEIDEAWKQRTDSHADAIFSACAICSGTSDVPIQMDDDGSLPPILEEEEEDSSE